MPRRTVHLDETAQREAYESRQRGHSWTWIANCFGVTTYVARAAADDWASANGLPSPVNRRSERERAYAARRGMLVTGGTPTQGAAGTSVLDRNFGVEIEFRRRAVDGGITHSPEEIATALRAAGIAAHAEDYNHRTTPHWKLIYDSSSDRELVSPILRGQAGLDSVATAMRTVAACGGYITRSEGGHVHVDISDFDAQQVATLLLAMHTRQAAFDALQPASRSALNGAQWCAQLDRYQLDIVAALQNGNHTVRSASRNWGSRYRALNLDPYQRQQTIEFRQGAGTLNPTKANAWVALMLGCVAAAKAGAFRADTPVDVHGLLDWLQAGGFLAARHARRLHRTAVRLGTPEGAAPEQAAPVAAPAPAPVCTCGICADEHRANERCSAHRVDRNCALCISRGF